MKPITIILGVIYSLDSRNNLKAKRENKVETPCRHALISMVSTHIYEESNRIRTNLQYPLPMWDKV